MKNVIRAIRRARANSEWWALSKNKTKEQIKNIEKVKKSEK